MKSKTKIKSKLLSLLHPGLGHLYFGYYQDAMLFALVPFLFIPIYVFVAFIGFGAPFVWISAQIIITLYWLIVIYISGRHFIKNLDNNTRIMNQFQKKKSYLVITLFFVTISLPFYLLTYFVFSTLILSSFFR